MNFILWIIVGGLIGWIASMIMGTNQKQGTLSNILVGIVGAFLAGYVITPLFGTGTINQRDFSLPGLLTSLGGAVLLLAIVRLFTKNKDVQKT
ncbi:MAG TPA: GlsB/YeaQ/YmgE family stress response membrane protein [Clostridiales bacterium]|nr:GlsB/YeaQ/YmgE family stress response membrane protein [Clostridiales bacterium]